MAHPHISRLVHALVAAVLAASVSAHAHDRTTSYSTWQLFTDRAKVVLTMSEADVAILSPGAGNASALDPALARYSAENLVLLADDQVCEITEAPRRLDAPAGRVSLEWSVACPPNGNLTICSELFSRIRTSHLHFAKLRHASGDAERVLTSSERSWNLGSEARRAGAASSATSIAGYWRLGVEHIATGYDHLVFLLALMLSGGSLTSLVKVVTGFTVGHSVTLALASLGLVRPSIGPVEALIGLSIALVAVENVWLLGDRSFHLPASVLTLLVVQAGFAVFGFGRVSSLSCLGFAGFFFCYYRLIRLDHGLRSARWPVALLFGLIHGFSFASVLSSAGLPAERIARPLIGFNAGVEIGQLLVILLAWPILRLALSRWDELAVEAGSSVTLGIGVYWFVLRAYT